MTTKTVTWVSDIGDPTDRGVRYVNVAFADGDTGFIGKKEYDAALEVHGLLTEAKDKTLDFFLEDTGKKNGKGKTKWKLKGFGEYQPTPYVQGAVPGSAGGHRSAASGRSPEHSDDIRHAVAMKAAATFRRGAPYDELKRAYLFIDGLLQETVRVNEAHSTPATAEPVSPSTAIKHADTDRGQAGEMDKGKVQAPACPPHDVPRQLKGRGPCKRCGEWVEA